MKIIDVPKPEHEECMNTRRIPHVSRKGKYYVVSKTVDGWTYHFGCYSSFEDAAHVNHLLMLRGYPTSLSSDNLRLRGEEYTEKLMQLLGE